MVCCPGGAGTRHIVDRAVLRALGPGGLVVNLGRGSSIDEAALMEALQAGEIGGAGLDVFEAEPAVPEALLACRNVVLAPHRGGTRETWRETAAIIIANLRAFFRGEALPNPIP